MGLVWRLGAFQKSPDTKGTRVEECKKMRRPGAPATKEAKARQKTCKKNTQTKCKQHAKKMRSKFGKAKTLQTKCKNAKKQRNMQKQRKEHAKHCKNNMILLFFEFSRFNAESTPESALRPHILVAVVLHFVCVFFSMFVALLLPPSSRAPLAFAFFLHSSTRVPFVPGAFWKAPSLQTNPLIHEPQLGEFRMWLGRTPQHSKTARPKVRANITS